MAILSSGLMAGTDMVFMDEPCLLLTEQHMQAPDSRGFRRYQILIVRRNDRPTEFRLDLGPASQFKDARQFRIPGGFVDERTGRVDCVETVGSLMDVAEALRAGKGTQIELVPELGLVERYHDEMDRRHRVRRGTVTIGAGTFKRRD